MGSRKKNKRKIESKTDIKIFNKKKNGAKDALTPPIFLKRSCKEQSVRASALMRAYRIRGHLIADLDPLGLLKREEHPELKPETYGFYNKDYNRKIFLDSTSRIKTLQLLKEIIKSAKDTYCGNIGYEFMHMADPERKILD